MRGPLNRRLTGCGSIVDSCWLAWRTRSVLYGALLHVYLISLILLVTST